MQELNLVERLAIADKTESDISAISRMNLLDDGSRISDFDKGATRKILPRQSQEDAGTGHGS